MSLSTNDQGSFATLVAYPLWNETWDANGPVAFGLEVADLNSDTMPDLVATYRSPGNSSADLSVFENLMTPGVSITTSSFGTRIDFDINEEHRSVEVADFDGDGDLDIATPGAAGSVLALARNVHLVGSLSATSFEPFTIIPAYEYAAGITSDVLDQDGDIDLVLTNEAGASAAISIFSNDGSGSFEAAAWPRVELPLGGIAIYPGIADLDGDGLLDLAATSYGEGAISIYQRQ